MRKIEREKEREREGEGPEFEYWKHYNIRLWFKIIIRITVF